MPLGFEEHFNTHIKPNYVPEKKNVEPDRVPTKLEMEREQTARDIARGGGFENILKTLRDHGLWEEQKRRVLAKNWDIFELDFLADPKNEKAVDALIALELYDPLTFEHSLGTFRIAKDTIEKPLMFDDQPIILAEKIQEEKLVGLEEFYLACLLHDIGKIEIPHFIISSEITHSEWTEMLIDVDMKNGDDNLLRHALGKSDIEVPDDIVSLPESNQEQKEKKKSQLLGFLSEKNVRCYDYVPIKEAVNNPLLGNRAFSQKNINDMEQRFADRGITRESAFFDIIKIHEKESSEITENVMRLPKIIATLVGMHHDYEGKYEGLQEKYPITLSSFVISNKLEEIIRVLDKYQAIKNKRSYKDSEPDLQTLLDLSREVDGKKICYFVGYIIIKNDLEKIRATLHSEEEKTNVKKLDTILQGFRQKI